MIIYGWNTWNTKKKQLSSVSCQSCGKRDVYHNLIHRYFHVYWVPVIPCSKVRYTQCESCQDAHADKEIPEIYSLSFSESGVSTRPPAILFSGAFFVAIIIGAVFYYKHQKDQSTLAYLQTPQLSDYYVLNLTKMPELVPGLSGCAVFKVTEVDEESVKLAYPQYFYSSRIACGEAISRGEVVREDYFGEKTLQFARAALTSLREKRQLLQVSRKNNIRGIRTVDRRDNGYQSNTSPTPRNSQLSRR